MAVLFLTGPAGAGKNTIGYLLAKQRNRCALIDGDMIRWMYIQPHIPPWKGKDGKAQQKLSIKNTSMLTVNFDKENVDVIILEILTDERVLLYRKYLKNMQVTTILLLPEFQETQKRLSKRKYRISLQEEQEIYTSQQRLTQFDRKIDNTHQTPESVADSLKSAFR